MNETLKAAGHIGAELGAAKAENARLRGLLREAIHCCPDEQLRNEMKAALSQQAEPNESELEALGLGYPFSKEDAVKLWYKGFRTEPIALLEVWEAIGHDVGIDPSKHELMDSLRNMEAICRSHGYDFPSPAEPAPAQDEREAPTVVATAILGGLFHGGSGPELGEIDIEVCTSALEKIQCETVNSSDDAFLPLMTVAQHERIVAALTRPAQTEQQPVPDAVWEALQRMIETTHQLGPHSREDAQLVARYRDRYRLLAVPQPEQSVPEGFALVPVKPTVEMIAALGFEGDEVAAIGHASIFSEMTECYGAMLAVAPSPAMDAKEE
jgi:hypothetical protein